MKIEINTQEILAAMDRATGQMAYATMLGINKTAQQVRSDLQAEMQDVFDRPTPWVVNSLRIKFATKANLVANIAYKDKNSVESSRSMLEPHVRGGNRQFKAMEVRLFQAGLLPAGWNAVPGGAANIDGYGNMSQGQITQLLNVMGTYKEAGYNKANSKTIERLKKGNKKKNVYGFEYFYNPPGGTGPGSHLPPGIYQRVSTGFGSSLKPVLVFVRRAAYKRRFMFDEIAGRTVKRDMQTNFTEAVQQALSTALLKSQGELL